MSIKNILKILLMISLILLLVAIFYLLIFHDFSSIKNNFISKKEKIETNITPPKKKKNSKFNKIENNIVKKQNKVIDNNTGFILEKKASFFAERFGTYSNQSQFKNIKDLEIFMTDDMKKWADNFINKQNSIKYSGQYSGVTTRAIKSEIVSLDKNNGFAVVVVDVQKIKSNAEGDKTPTMAKLRINFVNTNNRWLVNKANWQ